MAYHSMRTKYLRAVLINRHYPDYRLVVSGNCKSRLFGFKVSDIPRNEFQWYIPAGLIYKNDCFMSINIFTVDIALNKEIYIVEKYVDKKYFPFFISLIGFK